MGANWKTRQGTNKFKIILLSHNMAPNPKAWKYNIDTTSLSFRWPTIRVKAITGKWCILIMPKGWTLYKRFPRNYISEFFSFRGVLFYLKGTFYSMFTGKWDFLGRKMTASFTQILVKSNQLVYSFVLPGEEVLME